MFLSTKLLRMHVFVCVFFSRLLLTINIHKFNFTPYDWFLTAVVSIINRHKVHCRNKPKKTKLALYLLVHFALRDTATTVPPNTIAIITYIYYSIHHIALAMQLYP